MKYNTFGKTGWRVSALSLGTVELGVPYGLYRSQESSIPSLEESIKLLHYAFEQGINFLDTAPAYGNSEEIVGLALKGWSERVYVATKVDNNKGLSGKQLVAEINKSIDNSLLKLGVGTLDLVQIHNGTVADFDDGYFMEALCNAKQRGKLQHVGVSVYGEEDALRALDEQEISCVQVAYNLLDQRMGKTVFARAKETGRAVLIRSALLKGVLTDRQELIPAHLTELAAAAKGARQWASELGEPLAHAALGFCLSTIDNGSVLQGVRSKEELDDGLATVNQTSLSEPILESARGLAVDSDVVDPRFWGF